MPRAEMVSAFFFANYDRNIGLMAIPHGGTARPVAVNEKRSQKPRMAKLPRAASPF